MIGMYAHHMGSGHLRRVRAIAAHLQEPVTIFSSAPGADVRLPLDVPAPGVEPVEATARDSLHWVPLGVDGLRERMAAVAEFVRVERPRVFYVDVSVEVAAFVRLMGVPVVTLAMPGDRFDAAHQLGYSLAEKIVAAWPSWVPVPDHLKPHGDRLVAVGGISLLPSGPAVERGEEVVILRGTGGDNLNTTVWPGATVLGGERRVDDPGPFLRRAGLVVSAAGQNSVADLASVGAPAIVVPQERPHQEQLATARILEAEGLAAVCSTWPGPAEVEALWDRARSGAAHWSRWETDGSAWRAAREIEEVGL